MMHLVYSPFDITLALTNPPGSRLCTYVVRGQLADLRRLVEIHTKFG
jgi:hypothetical protein